MKLNWSRRELEAFGEPLGDSVTQRKLGGGYICGGGGGKGGGGGGAPAPAPTQTTAYNTNIPEYARPYVQSMLGATQKQLFETSDGQITGFKPYTPYSTDPTAYVAPFSPQQEQAFKGVANLQQPGQFAPATGLAAASGLGSLGIAGQAAGTGADYYSLATSPEAMGAFMSPYMQNAVDRQKFEATRDYAKQLQAQKAQAVGAGAFGGSRQAIVESEAQRNLNQQLQNIQAAGTQQAFQQAQQAQQFGAGLGLQGLQASLQGLGQAGQAAGTLGQLGTAQQATDLDRLRSQQQMGALQQQRQQDIINQAVQNYAIQQQYPLMQLGFMSNMLRGLPLQSQTTQLYQAQPTTTQQAIGLLGAGASLFGKAGGGAIKEYREGGIASAAPGYKYGTLISEPKLEAMADDLTVEQLQARLRDPALTPGERQIFQEALAEKMQQEKARVSGIAMAGGPAFESQGMAGGGIVAFSDGGLGMINPEFGGGDQTMDRLRIEQLQLQKDIDQYNFLKDASPVAAERMLASNPMLRDKVSPAPAPAPVAAAKPPAPKEEKEVADKKDDRSAGARSPITKAKTAADFLAEQKEMGPKGELGADFEKFISERLGKSGERLSRDERMAMAKGFLKFASTPAPGGIMQAAAAGLGEYATGVEAARKTQDAMELEAKKMQVDLEKARRAEARGDRDAAQKAFDSYENRQLRVAEMQNALKVAGIQASRASDFERQYEAFKTDPAAFEKFRRSLTSQDDTARLNAYVKADTFISQAYPQLMFSKKPEDIQKLQEIRNAKVAEYLGAIGMTPQNTPAAIPQGVTVKKVG